MYLRFVVLSLLLFAFIDQTTTLSTWESAILALFLYFLLDFIHSFGTKIVITHFFIVLAFIQWLVMPIFAYHIFNQTNYSATLWNKFMEAPAEEYYSYIFPGTLAMILGLRFPLKQPQFTDVAIQYIERAKAVLSGKSIHGWTLLLSGLFFSSLNLFLVGNLGNVMFLLSALVYIGILYLYFSDFHYKKLVISLLIGIEVLNALKTGMFGGSLFLFVNIIILLGLQWKIKFEVKLFTIFLGFILVIILQSVKAEYRAATWKGSSKAGVSTFSDIAQSKLDNNSSLMSEDNLFFLVLRFNNGWQIARTMNRVPNAYPYANGESIALSLAATAVPRFLWPDKPTVGGKANLERFWGESYGRTSMNISPIGEAYANFGRFGGVIFMFFLGLTLNWCVLEVLRWVERHPTIICWFPIIFYSFYGIETDILSILNSFVKGVIFTYLFIRLYKFATKQQI